MWSNLWRPSSFQRGFSLIVLVGLVFSLGMTTPQEPAGPPSNPSALASVSTAGAQGPDPQNKSNATVPNAPQDTPETLVW